MCLAVIMKHMTVARIIRCVPKEPSEEISAEISRRNAGLKLSFSHTSVKFVLSSEGGDVVTFVGGRISGGSASSMKTAPHSVETRDSRHATDPSGGPER